jgi:hypothetical protein
MTRENVERLVKTLHSMASLRHGGVGLVTKWRQHTRAVRVSIYIASGYDTGFYGAYGMPVDYYEFKSLPSVMNTKARATSSPGFTKRAAPLWCTRLTPK